VTTIAARSAESSSTRQGNIESIQATASAPALPSATAVPVPAGALCPRCDRHALHGLECAHCGRVIITGLVGGPRLCPAEERAQATGHPYCPKCCTSDAQLYVTGAGDMCGPCSTRLLGRHVADLQPATAMPSA
jgi:hypothetical protein